MTTKTINPLSSRNEKEGKLGHRRVDEDGLVSFKRQPTSELMNSIQIGLGQSIGSLTPKPKRDVLYEDFDVVETVSFPRDGTNLTPAHRCSDFKFKTYAPVAFRYFRELFNILAEDFLLSLCDEPLRELSNPGASGSIFYISSDDEFIVKTVQKKEALFLQKLLPGYYLNLNQNPRTLLPKFYGLYCIQCGSKNIRFVIMNNLLPSTIELHSKYDLKGSTYKRQASESELLKSHPTFKDLDFRSQHPMGFALEADTYNALIRTIERDCRVLQSFKIMDYSMLIAVHNLNIKKIESTKTFESSSTAAPDNITEVEVRIKNSRQRMVQYSTVLESIHCQVDMGSSTTPEIICGGIPGKNSKGEKILIFMGIIDILQNYRFVKQLEHTLKSIITDGDAISVHRPGFYALRFQEFFETIVFKKMAPLPHNAIKNTPSNRKYEKYRAVSSSEQEENELDTNEKVDRPDVLPTRTSLKFAESLEKPINDKTISVNDVMLHISDSAPLTANKLPLLDESSSLNY